MTTNATTTPVLARLTATLEAKTTAALHQLATLDTEIGKVLAEAEQRAAERIADALAGTDHTIAYRLAHFEERLGELAASAFADALNELEVRIDFLAGRDGLPVDAVEEAEAQHAPHVNGKEYPVAETITTVAISPDQAGQPEQGEQPEPVEQPEQPAAEPTTPVEVSGPQADEPAPLAGQDEGEPAEELRLRRPETSTVVGERTDEVAGVAPVYAPTAARSIEADVPALVLDPEADGDPDDASADADADTPPSAIPVVTDPDGLHEKRGEGRGTRYVLCEFPEPGETYYVRGTGKPKWAPVVFAG